MNNNFCWQLQKKYPFKEGFDLNSSLQRIFETVFFDIKEELGQVRDDMRVKVKALKEIKKVLFTLDKLSSNEKLKSFSIFESLIQIKHKLDADTKHLIDFKMLSYRSSKERKYIFSLAAIWYRGTMKLPECSMTRENQCPMFKGCFLDFVKDVFEEYKIDLDENTLGKYVYQAIHGYKTRTEKIPAFADTVKTLEKYHQLNTDAV